MYVGKVTPDIYGGITSTMNWKNFDLSIFCQFAAGGKILSAWKGCGGTEGTEHLGLASSSIKGYKNGTLVDSEQFYNISKYAANHYWRGEGTSNTVPRPTLQARSPAVSETILFLPAIWKMLLISNSKPSHWDIAFLILCCQKYM